MSPDAHPGLMNNYHSHPHQEYHSHGNYISRGVHSMLPEQAGRITTESHLQTNNMYTAGLMDEINILKKENSLLQHENHGRYLFPPKTAKTHKYWVRNSRPNPPKIFQQ
jgi:hypothetical protein